MGICPWKFQESVLKWENPGVFLWGKLLQVTLSGFDWFKKPYGEPWEWEDHTELCRPSMCRLPFRDFWEKSQEISATAINNIILYYNNIWILYHIRLYHISPHIVSASNKLLKTWCPSQYLHPINFFVDLVKLPKIEPRQPFLHGGPPFRAVQRRRSTAVCASSCGPGEMFPENVNALRKAAPRLSLKTQNDIRW